MKLYGLLLASVVSLFAGRGLSAQCQLFEVNNGTEFVAMDGTRLVATAGRTVRIYERIGVNVFLEDAVDPVIPGDTFDGPGPVDVEGDVIIAGDNRDCVVILERIGGAWTQPWGQCFSGSYEGAGKAVALDGGRAVYWSTDGFDQRIHVMEQVAGVWTEIDVVFAPASATRRYGDRIALSGDWLFVVDGQLGVVYVHLFDGEDWPVQQILTGTPSLFGFSSGIAVSGDTLAVGAVGTPPGGVVAIFDRVGSLWQPAGVVMPSVAQGGLGFGRAMDLEGDHLVVGTTGLDAGGGAIGAGGAFAFDRTQTGWDEVGVLIPPSRSAFDAIGAHVATDGDLAALVDVASGGQGGLFLMSASNTTCPTLESFPNKISVSAGGDLTLLLKAPLAEAGRTYFLAGSLSGNDPGFVLRGERVPLNPDFYFGFSLRNANSGPFSMTFGSLDAGARANATVTVPVGSSPSLAGLELFHAFVVFEGSIGGPISHVSNPTTVLLEL